MRGVRDEHGLTSRQVEIASLIAEGLNSREIGARLFVAESTVNSHVKLMLVALGAANRAQLLAILFRRGLLPLPAPLP